MRSASDDYEAANTRTRADVANQARSAADAYQGALDQVRGSTMEGMRSAADQFSVNNDRTASDLASSMRESSDRFVEGNADRLGDAAEFNAKMINDAASEGKQFLQDAYAETMRNRNTWDRDVLNAQTDIATGTRSHDADQNTQGFGQAERVGQADTGRLNSSQDSFNDDQLGVYQGGSAGVLAGRGREADASANIVGGIYDTGAETGNTVVSALGGSFGGGGMPPIGGGGGAGGVTPQGNQALPSNIKDPWEDY